MGNLGDDVIGGGGERVILTADSTAFMNYKSYRFGDALSPWKRGFLRTEVVSYDVNIVVSVIVLMRSSC